MDAVADTTKFNFEQVYELPIMDFFAYVRYIDYKRRREQAAIDKMKGKIRIA